MNKLYATYFKRPLDLVAASVLLIVFSPVMLIVAIVLFFTKHSPVYFLQQRVGYREKIFTIIKFKSMNDARDEQGGLLPDSKRLTRFGSFIRKTSLDELPQLINVVKGDMSLIGPRPLLVSYLKLYNDEQKRRHLVRPGITGWAQVNGRNAITWSKKFEYDLWYVDHQGLLLDIRILWLTIINTVRSKDINQEGQATIQAFTGNET